MAVFTAGFAGLVALTVSLHGEAARSAGVQAHGIRAEAVVMSVDNVYHRHGGYYTALVTVALDPPLMGRSVTTVHYPHSYARPDGTRAVVLVDPHDAGYAEIPGSPDSTDSTWILSAVLAAVVGLVMAASGWSAARVLLHRRSYAARAASD